MLEIKKRDGKLATLNPNKILSRIKKAAKGLKVNPDEIFVKVVTSLPTKGIVTTVELDKLISETAAAYSTSHYDYSKLAASVAISALHKSSKSFSDITTLFTEKGITGSDISEKIERYGAERVNSLIEDKDYDSFNYFAWKALEQTYLLKDNELKISETPQQMYLRVALYLTDTFEEAVALYEDLKQQYISFATPILINSNTINPQLASCVLVHNAGDSRLGILQSLDDASVYSAAAAGIGINLTNVRSKESRISTSGGYAGGVLKYVKMINEHLRFFNQNGKRPGAAAVYLEVWHRDVEDLIDIRKNTGIEEARARDTFAGLVVPDNFMRAVEANEDYYLFCPDEIKKAGLKAFQTIYGEEFEEEYSKAIELGLGRKIKAKDLLLKIESAQIETGVPYILFKDAINSKSNHKGYGVSGQSNLCAEIVQYTDEDTTAICTLASQVLKNYVKDKQFDFKLLYAKTKTIVRTLNKVIDINAYITERGSKGGLEQRAIAIGVQGLADTLYLLDVSFESEEAKDLNKKIFETIYFAAIEESCRLVREGLFPKFKDHDKSPMSQGIFQFDMWEGTQLSGMWDWDALRKDVMEYGVCNSMFTALMPTAGSAKITDSYESFEPMHSNLFARKVLGGEITIPNKYLIDDLSEIGIWNEDIKNEIIINDGSIQAIQFDKYIEQFNDQTYRRLKERIEHLKSKYKTIWEIKQKVLLDLAIDRGPFIDQTQSMNVYFAEPSASKLTSSLFYAWKGGLKTGNYYLRSKAISTGAKHLGIDVAAAPTPKPSNSIFECEGGCSA